MISVTTTVTSEGIFLILTWIRTYGIKKDWSRLGVHTPLTTLLLRDGESGLSIPCSILLKQQPGLGTAYFV